MKQLVQDKFLLIFLPVIAAVLYASITNSFTLYIVFKPLIVGTLLMYLFINKGHQSKAAMHVVAGLIFSLIGDVLLIFEQAHPLFFMGGLISFLIAHIFYIIYYMRSSENARKGDLKNKSVLILALITYGVVFYILLYNNLGALKAPVLIYTTVLISMNIFALNRYGKVNSKSFSLVMIGALFFASSDSLLALNKFLLPLPFPGVWILATYAAAQYFITEGVLNLSPAFSSGEGVKINRL